MLALILFPCFVLTCGQNLEFQGQQFKEDIELLSRGCDDPAFNAVFENLAHDPLYQLKRNEVLKFKENTRIIDDSSSFAFGYHAREVHAISGNFYCFYNEKCIIKVAYTNEQWYTSIERIWIRPHFNENPFQDKIYPLLERNSSYFLYKVLGPTSISLNFIPIVWGYWKKTVIVRGSIFARHYMVCSGQVISPRVKGFPDGWIEPVLTPLNGDFI
ncbi:hypothetical protein DSO57_1001522 [Entomophthora muscae]|uniref:Uncharacterized protein n=1 Tax=Entomophthora muscae TaxID=34485 RepID=A0ACC2RNY6_9FUNG|nr:hypothetical protein DSO57_1001522 [Entomophthora muscae]